jgi:hypothetical protein
MVGFNLSQFVGKINLSQFAVVMKWIGIIIGFAGLLGFGLWWAWLQKQFSYKCYVLEEMSDGGTRIYETKGRLKKRPDGTRIFVLKMFKEAKLPTPPLNSFMIGAKGEKCVFLRKFSLNEFDFIPLGVYIKGLQTDLVPFTQERRNWITTELKRSYQRYETFWDRFGGAILNIIVLLIAFVMIIVIFKMAGEIVNSQNALGSQLIEATKQMCSSKTAEVITQPNF